jgi:hypothetical protein
MMRRAPSIPHLPQRPTHRPLSTVSIPASKHPQFLFHDTGMVNTRHVRSIGVRKNQVLFNLASGSAHYDKIRTFNSNEDALKFIKRLRFVYAGTFEKELETIDADKL